MKLIRTTLLFAIVSGLTASPAVRADDTTDAINALKQQIQELTQKVQALEHQKETETKSADAKSKDTARVTIGNNGLVVSSADTNFVFGLHGLLQVDNRTFFRESNIK